MVTNIDKIETDRKLQTLEKFRQQKFLLLSLMGSGIAILFSEHFGKQVATGFTDIIFIPVTVALVILSVVSLRREGIRGDHGKAWIVFTIFAICWCIAEQIWTLDELVYHVKPFPSSADFFYLVGYPAYFVFSILYIKPVMKAISKKMVFSACLISVAVLIPNLYMTFSNNSDENQFNIALGATYPIADAIVLVPSLLGVMLFFGGKVNFLWVLMSLGILINVVADTGFQYYSLDDSYYTGHPIDILYLWAYIVFAFGVYGYMKIFKNEKNNQRFFDQENLR